MKNENAQKIEIGHMLKKMKWHYCYLDGSEAPVPEDIKELNGPSLYNSWGKISRKLKEHSELLAALETAKKALICSLGYSQAMNAKAAAALSEIDAAIAKAKGE